MPGGLLLASAADIVGCCQRAPPEAALSHAGLEGQVAVSLRRASLFTGSGVKSDGLQAWAERSGRHPVVRPLAGGLRFAFYGRLSTEDYQDPSDIAGAAARSGGRPGWRVRADRGRVLRRRAEPGAPMGAPPQAAALLAAMADPDRAFDAIVIGEYERAFYGSQYALMAPLFEHYGVQL